MTNVEVRKTDSNTVQDRRLTVVVGETELEVLKQAQRIIDLACFEATICNDMDRYALEGAKAGIGIVMTMLELDKSKPSGIDIYNSPLTLTKKVVEFAKEEGVLTELMKPDTTPVEKIQLAIDSHQMVKPIPTYEINEGVTREEYRVELFDRNTKEPENINEGSNLVGYITISDEKAQFMWLSPFIDEFRSALDYRIDQLGVDEIVEDYGKRVTIEQAISHWVWIVKNSMQDRREYE